MYTKVPLSYDKSSGQLPYFGCLTTIPAYEKLNHIQSTPFPSLWLNFISLISTIFILTFWLWPSDFYTYLLSFSRQRIYTIWKRTVTYRVLVAKQHFVDFSEISSIVSLYANFCSVFFFYLFVVSCIFSYCNFFLNGMETDLHTMAVILKETVIK